MVYNFNSKATLHKGKNEYFEERNIENPVTYCQAMTHIFNVKQHVSK